MVFVESFVGSLIAQLIANGFQNVSAEKTKEGNTNILSDGKTVFTLDKNLLDEPLDFCSSLTGISTVSLNTKSVKPQVRISNPLKRDIVIYDMSFGVDAIFKTKGYLTVNVGGLDVTNIKGGTLKNSSTYNIPIPPRGLIWKKGKDIDIFVWSSDGSAVEISHAILVGQSLESSI